VQTDNSYPEEKIGLRTKHLPDKSKIRVLDCFAGDGRIWESVQMQTDKSLVVTSIEKEDRGSALALKGDNVKWLRVLDLTKFDVIDLDAYGVPFRQLEVLFARVGKRTGKMHIFVTYIQSQYGAIHYGMLEILGYPRSMIRRCPTMFYRKGWEKFLSYLGTRGVRQVTHRSYQKKHYVHFRI
jgi:hypothetical protein